MPTIEINDTNESTLSFDMIDILTVLEPFARELDWYFIEFVPGVFVGATDPEPNVKPWVIALYHQIERSERAVKVSWETLKNFARNIVQTEMTLLVALKPGEKEPLIPVDVNSTEFEIVLQGVDNSFWAVTTKNDAIIHQLKLRFKNTEIVPGTRSYF
jgi:hypothetical protein